MVLIVLSTFSADFSCLSDRSCLSAAFVSRSYCLRDCAVSSVALFVSSAVVFTCSFVASISPLLRLNSRHDSSRNLPWALSLLGWVRVIDLSYVTFSFSSSISSLRFRAVTVMPSWCNDFLFGPPKRGSCSMSILGGISATSFSACFAKIVVSVFYLPLCHTSSTPPLFRHWQWLWLTSLVFRSLRTSPLQSGEVISAGSLLGFWLFFLARRRAFYGIIRFLELVGIQVVLSSLTLFWIFEFPLLSASAPPVHTGSCKLLDVLFALMLHVSDSM